MIKNKSTYSYKFRSDGLTKSKFDQINLVCTDYIKLKNEVSKTVFDNYLEEVNRGKGMKMSGKLKWYFMTLLPILILIILIQGLI